MTLRHILPEEKQAAVEQSPYVQELLAKIDSLRSKNRQKAAKIEELYAENEDFQEKIQKLRTENKELRSKIQELSRKPEEPAIAPPQAGHLGKTATNAVYRGTYELFTDGACDPNPGFGGWAFILKDSDTGKEFIEVGREPRTTNNRMEMMAVIAGLTKLEKPANVTVVSDSKYVIDGMSSWMKKWKGKGWTRSGGIKNLELWKKLDALVSKHNVSYKWVKGHSGHPENERCDRLAMEQVRLGKFRR